MYKQSKKKTNTLTNHLKQNSNKQSKANPISTNKANITKIKYNQPQPKHTTSNTQHKLTNQANNQPRQLRSTIITQALIKPQTTQIINSKLTRHNKQHTNKP